VKLSFSRFNSVRRPANATVRVFVAQAPKIGIEVSAAITSAARPPASVNWFTDGEVIAAPTPLLSCLALGHLLLHDLQRRQRLSEHLREANRMRRLRQRGRNRLLSGLHDLLHLASSESSIVLASPARNVAKSSQKAPELCPQSQEQDDIVSIIHRVGYWGS
jgi:hypothetical protein